jgi:hypothetical protein
MLASIAHFTRTLRPDRAGIPELNEPLMLPRQGVYKCHRPVTAEAKPVISR